jgi:hypothetical protein
MWWYPFYQYSAASFKAIGYGHGGSCSPLCRIQKYKEINVVGNSLGAMWPYSLPKQCECFEITHAYKKFWFI